MEKIVIPIIIFLVVNFAQSQSIHDETQKQTKMFGTVRNYDNLTRIEEILELFSVHVIGAEWTKIHSRLSPACSHDMVEYLDGLEQSKIWAIKSELLSCSEHSEWEWKQFRRSFQICKEISLFSRSPVKIKKSTKSKRAEKIGISQLHIDRVNLSRTQRPASKFGRSFNSKNFFFTHKTRPNWFYGLYGVNLVSFNLKSLTLPKPSAILEYIQTLGIKIKKVEVYALRTRNKMNKKKREKLMQLSINYYIPSCITIAAYQAVKKERASMTEQTGKPVGVNFCGSGANETVFVSFVIPGSPVVDIFTIKNINSARLKVNLFRRRSQLTWANGNAVCLLKSFFQFNQWRNECIARLNNAHQGRAVSKCVRRKRLLIT